MRRLLTAVLLTLVLCVGAHASGPVASVSVVGSTTAASPVDTTGAHLLLAIVQDVYGALPTVSDSAGNTWMSGPLDSGQTGSGIYYVINPVTSPAHTFRISFPGSSFVPSLAVLAFGDNVTALDKSVMWTSQIGGPASLTPAQSGELLIAALAGFGWTGTAGIGGGYSIATQTEGVALAWQLDSGITPVTPGWTFQGSYATYESQIAFLIGSGPGGGSTQQPQTISLATPIVTLNATASSGLPVSYSSLTPAVCSVSGNAVALASTGICTVEASQTGNGVYLAAPPVTQSFQLTSPTGFDLSSATWQITEPSTLPLNWFTQQYTTDNNVLLPSGQVAFSFLWPEVEPFVAGEAQPTSYVAAVDDQTKYITASQSNIYGKNSITLGIDDISLNGTPIVFNYNLTADNTCTSPAAGVHVAIMTGTDWGIVDQDSIVSARPQYTIPLALGPQSITIPLTPDAWVFRISGSPVDAANFQRILSAVSNYRIGFGGGCFYSHGVTVSGGPVQFVLTQFSVQ